MSNWDEPGWYDSGGFLNVDWSPVTNDSGQAERVLTADQIRAGLDYMRKRYGTGSNSTDED